MNDDHRDYDEETHNANLCPACGTSPCAGGGAKGSRDPAPDPENYCQTHDLFDCPFDARNGVRV